MFRSKKVGWLISVGVLVCLVGSLFVACAPAAPAELEEALAAAEKKVIDLEKKMAGMVAAPQAYKLKVHGIWTPESPWQTKMIQRFADNLEAMSDGRFDITIYPAGAIVPSLDLVSALGKGTVDLAFTCGAYTAAQIGYLGTLEFGLPRGFENSEEVGYFWYEMGFIEELREAYAEHGVYYIGPGAIYSTETIILKEPVSKAADFKGILIRDIGMEAMVYENLGATISYMPIEELYTALATGVIDAVGMNGPVGILDLKFYEVAKYIMWPPLMAGCQVDIVASKDLWDDLPDDLKAIADVAVRECCRDTGCWTTYEAYGGLKKLIEEEGCSVVSIPEDEMMEAVSKAWDELAAKDPVTGEWVQKVRDYLKVLGR